MHKARERDGETAQDVRMSVVRMSGCRDAITGSRAGCIKGIAEPQDAAPSLSRSLDDSFLLQFGPTSISRFVHLQQNTNLPLNLCIPLRNRNNVEQLSTRNCSVQL